MMTKQEMKLKCLDLALKHCLINDKTVTGMKIERTAEDFIKISEKFMCYLEGKVSNLTEQ